MAKNKAKTSQDNAESRVKEAQAKPGKALTRPRHGSDEAKVNRDNAN